MKKHKKHSSGEKCVGGWVQNSSQHIYENPWISVRHDEVTRPDGSEGVYGVVHFKYKALGIVPVDADGNTWLVRQSRYSCNETSLEIPEGGGAYTESPQQEAARELEEETGLRAKSWEQLMVLRTSNSITDEIAHVFLATDIYLGTQNLDATEDIEVVKMTLKQAIDLAICGDITDAMSVSALLKIAYTMPHIVK